MLIVGTAGHIDHGKTTLIGVLTGMDTDRLAEEKRRGISIDLGFAHLSAIDGSQVSFIDVPGHERFVKNMLAGVGGIGAVLLVVAADEGIKPQTREHFEICRLLQIPTGVIALTKVDLATPEQLATTRLSVAALVKDTFLEAAPILSVSAKTGTGLAQLRTELLRLSRVQAIRDTDQLARLNIDRSFAAKGFGTVVTGSLLQGQLRTGDPVKLHPVNKLAKIRSLQVHGKHVETATAGDRTAVNLSGVDHTEVTRGLVLMHRNEVTPSSLIDVSVEWLADELVPVKRQQYLLHAGTAEIMANLKMIGPGHARIWLAAPALMLPGDRFILRLPSPLGTVGGGTIVDAFPPSRLSRSKVNERLLKLEGTAWPKRIELLVKESTNGRRLTELVKRTGLTVVTIRKHVAANPELIWAETAQRVLSRAWITATREQLSRWLEEFHRNHPDLPGAPIVQARMNLEPALAEVVFKDFPAIRVFSDTIALATHRVQISPAQARMLAEIERQFRQGGLQPPAPLAVLQSAGTDGVKGRPFLEALIKAQRLVRISDDIVFHAEAIDKVRQSLGSQKGRRFSIPEFKEWTQISRKFAVPLLEYLDRQHITRREGDSRIIL